MRRSNLMPIAAVGNTQKMRGISQVIINFLSNAVKFTSAGEITVTFRQMMLHDGVADMMIRVHDTGIGMDPGFISRIFRFVLLDVQMPVMDGHTAARTIRAINRPDAKTVLMFALSADAFVEDERLSAESGMNGHFAKPVDFAALQRSIGKFLRQRRG